MKAVKSIITVCLLSLLSLQPASATASPTIKKAEQINAILEKTGFNKLLKHTPNFSQSVLKQSSGALEPEMGSALSAAFTQAFATAAVQRDINHVLEAHYNEAHATAYLKHLNSALSLKMAKLESDTNNPANREDIKAFSAALTNQPTAASRSKLIEHLDKATRTTDFSIDMQTAFFKAIFVAIEPVMEADMRISEDELEKMVSEVRTSLEEGLRNNTRLSFLYAFRNISDAELQSYIDICESEEYRWGIQLLGNAMISAINQAADRAALSMSQNNR